MWIVYRFNKLAWGFPDAASRPSGVIASGMDNGELAIWDPERIVASAPAVGERRRRRTSKSR